MKKSNIYICTKELNEPYLAGFKFKKGKKYQLIDRNSAFVIIGEVAVPVNVFNTHFKEREVEDNEIHKN